MNENKLREAIRTAIKKELAEAPATAPSKPKEAPGPAIAPSKPGTGKPKPRRPLGNPDVKPKPKATMNEAEILAKIIKRFKDKKQIKEIYAGFIPKNRGQRKTWEEGYKEGYLDGFSDSEAGKGNKFMEENLSEGKNKIKYHEDKIKFHQEQLKRLKSKK